jgi:hypothetical protein
MGNHVATPIGKACGRCGKPIEGGDQGIIIGVYAADSDVEAHGLPGPVHLRCSGLSLRERD